MTGGGGAAEKPEPDKIVLGDELESAIASLAFRRRTLPPEPLGGFDRELLSEALRIPDFWERERRLRKLVADEGEVGKQFPPCRYGGSPSDIAWWWNEAAQQYEYRCGHTPTQHCYEQVPSALRRIECPS